MDNNFHLWNSINNIEISGKVNESVIKMSNIDNHLYLLTATNNLFHGMLSSENKSEIAFIHHKDNKFFDIDCSEKFVYAVDAEGKVFQYTENLELISEIILIEESKMCNHGYKSPTMKLKVVKIAAGKFGNLYLTETGQLWASGNMPQIEINSEEPKKVIFFENSHVCSISIGKDFALIIASRAFASDDTDSEECDVFGQNCPHCKSGVTSPCSQKSETCPLGLLVNGNTDDNETSSTNSKSDNTSTSSSKLSQGETVESTSQEKVERNIIFRNTEAAKEFLSRQFSWMSAGEEYLVECTEKPTRIIKENVTTVANMVYEGVKTVGDKVVTLSRHVSGSSDNNELLDTIEDINLPRITSKDEFLWSLSQPTSEKDFSEHSMQDSCNVILKSGANLLNNEVWTWGNAHYGQLGIGDNIKRDRPMIITKLSNIGVKTACVGNFHAAVLTLDGKVFLWGNNDYHQVTVECNRDQSSPRLLVMDERVQDVACGSFHTVVYTNTKNLYYFGKYDLSQSTEKATKINSEFKNVLEDDTELNSFHNTNMKLHYNILASSRFTLLNNNFANNFLAEEITAEQKYLENFIIVHTNLIKQLQKKNIVTCDSDLYEMLCHCYTDLLNFTAVNLQSLLSFNNNQIVHHDIIMFKYSEEHLFLYQNYVNIVNNIIGSNGFNYISKIIDMHYCLYKVISADPKKADIDTVVQTVLIEPIVKLSSYIKIIQKFCDHYKKSQYFFDIHKKWTILIDEQHKKKLEAERTRTFWLNSGKTIEHLCVPGRRFILESHKHSVFLFNGSRFSSHWFILFNDIFVHVSGSTPYIHNLMTIWIEMHHDDSYNQNQIHLKMPEENIILQANESEIKTEWLQALQIGINTTLGKTTIATPSTRTASYDFTKPGFYKDSKYTGRWLNAKMHGSGKIEWNDKRIYIGQFHNNQLHGFGKMEIPDVGIYECQWKDNQQNGFGIFKHINGDVYKGYFSNGFQHGHGSLKQGHFTSNIASVYIGEWTCGNKNGYGVMDNIITGEKYLGNWLDNKKHGNGLIVTSDGVYYEGVFNQDVLMGQGLMILEDGTHYEGEFKGIGNLNGKGSLKLTSGHIIDGYLSGSINDVIKISNGILNLTKPTELENCSSLKSFCKFSSSGNEKWKALFRHCFNLLGSSEKSIKSNKAIDNTKIWQNIAVIISNLRRDASKKNKDHMFHPLDNNLDTIPHFGRTNIDACSFTEVKQYLGKAFESPHHPLGILLSDITVAYSTAYGGLRAHPLLLNHAIDELLSIVERIYEIVRMLFPALPPYGKSIPLEEDENEMISCQALLYPIVLPKVHSPLFVLYTLNNKQQEIQYLKRLSEWNKQSDYTLMAFLSVDSKFLTNQEQSFSPTALKPQKFMEAIEALQQLKTTFSPFEKLLIIRETFQKLTLIVQSQLGYDYKWNMDDLIPVFLFIVVRARIMQLGSELNFIDDFMETNLENGELGIMFTTLKACYQQILQEKILS